MSQAWRWRYAMAFGIAAVLVRFVFLLDVREASQYMDPNTDSIGYVQLADGLKHGCGFARAVHGRCMPLPGPKEARAARVSVDVANYVELVRTPGYPLFLSVMPSLSSAIVVQELLAGVLVFAIFMFVSARWGTGAAAISALFVTLDVSGILYSSELMSDVLFAFFFVLGLLAELDALGKHGPHRFASVLLASALFGAATITRPLAQFVVMAMALIPFFFKSTTWSKRVGFAALTVAFTLLVVVGWSWRNYRLTGLAQFSPVGAVNLFYYRAGGTLVYANHLRALPHLEPQGPDLARQALRIIARHPVAFAEMTLSNFVYLSLVPERSTLAHFLRIHTDFPVQEGGSTRLRLALSKILISPVRTLGDIYRGEFFASPLMLGLTIFQLIFAAVLWSGALTTSMRAANFRSDRGLCVIFLAACAFLFLLMGSGAEAQPRYRVPAVPFLAILSGVAWASFLPGSESRHADTVG